jgi:hypothetical protein
MSLLYRGPVVFSSDGPFVHWWNRPQHRPIAQTALPIVRSEPADNMVASVHESTHACYFHFTDRGVGSVEV